MATMTLPRPIPPHRPASTPTSTSLAAPITPPFSLEALDSSKITDPVPSQPCAAPTPVPNKHLPICPTGPARNSDLDTPPSSPDSSAEEYQQCSILYPPDGFRCLETESLSIYEIRPAQVADAIDFISTQPLPPPSHVFPWLHGLNSQNQLQLAFFNARRRAIRKTPTCLRGLTIVKADGDLNVARLKGAIAPEEFLRQGPNPEFIEADPRDGFSVRNFQIQPVKSAVTSDIIIYGDNISEVCRVAWDVAAAQKQWRQRRSSDGELVAEYNTFVCMGLFEEFEEHHSDIVSVDSRGRLTGHVIDFVHQERREMWDMTEASEISHNVFLGPTPEPSSPEEQQFDVLIECNDAGRLDPAALRLVAYCPHEKVDQPFHDFPSSGSILPPTWSHTEADGILESCKWIYHIAHGTLPSSEHKADDCDVDGDFSMTIESDETCRGSPRPRKILIHCADGYTESSMLGVAYHSYSTGRPIPDAWLNLHTAKKRNFFAYPSDVALLTAIAPRLLQDSPACADRSLQDITNMIRDEPAWFSGLDGSFPSRILDYLYLGNLGHANNPDLLREMGITQLLSVGETAIWREGDAEKWGEDNVCSIQGVQDNGIDPLTEEFMRCLEFIERGKRNGTATLVHCRVGVSRSATICIAEVMRSMNLSFPRAYCFVRARRLNVIIQPHLRFAYELLKWEEYLQTNGNTSRQFKRELEWCEIAREIALMNRPYAR